MFQTSVRVVYEYLYARARASPYDPGAAPFPTRRASGRRRIRFFPEERGKAEVQVEQHNSLNPRVETAPGFNVSTTLQVQCFQTVGFEHQPARPYGAGASGDIDDLLSDLNTLMPSSSSSTSAAPPAALKPGGRALGMHAQPALVIGRQGLTTIP